MCRKNLNDEMARVEAFKDVHTNVHEGKERSSRPSVMTEHLSQRVHTKVK